jgi:hypothetical protein
MLPLRRATWCRDFRVRWARKRGKRHKTGMVLTLLSSGLPESPDRGPWRALSRACPEAVEGKDEPRLRDGCGELPLMVSFGRLRTGSAHLERKLMILPAKSVPSASDRSISRRIGRIPVRSRRTIRQKCSTRPHGPEPLRAGFKLRVGSLGATHPCRQRLPLQDRACGGGECHHSAAPVGTARHRVIAP